MHAEESSPAPVVPLGMPVLLEQHRATIGAVLVHGFTGSPYQMLDLAHALHAAGYRVAVPRLAGHATSVRDLARTTLEDWQRGVHDAVAEMAEHVDRVVLIGYSFGGVLVLRELLADERGVLAAVLLATPAPCLRDRLRALALPLLLPFRATVRKPWARLDEADARRAQGRYADIPLRALGQYYRGLFAMTHTALSSITIPVFIAQGDAEEAIPSTSMAFYARTLPHASTHTVHQAGHDSVRLHREMQQQIIDFLHRTCAAP